MKRISLIIITIILCSVATTAQFSISNGNGYYKIDETESDLDAVILFNGIDLSSTITYTGSETDIEWRYTADGSEFTSNMKDINPDHNIRYDLYAGSAKILSLFVIDYTQYRTGEIEAEVISDPETVCDGVAIKLTSTIDNITFTDFAGASHTLPRTINVAWDDTEWNSTEWTDIEKREAIKLPETSVAIDAPKKNTTFKIFGDNYAELLGIPVDTTFIDYEAVTTEPHLVATVIEREYKNEKDRSSQSNIEGSGPLAIEFKSNANPLPLTYYEWIVFNTENRNNYSRYSDTDLNYTFEDTGEYIVRLTTSTDFCEQSDSVRVKVLVSFLEIPNVFTPNGDGMNDEWRVAYRSIERYTCIVQNRWGRTVFRSENPGEGWDGTIGGKPAAEGTYYYVIVAYGTDLDDKGKQKKYKFSGDINLLR